MKSPDQNIFSEVVDELVQLSKYDPELQAGIKWVDTLAQRKNMTFYEMMFEVLYKRDIKKDKEFFKN